ncbi:helix-turn-helix domain-containing protein [Streptomyces sp. 3211]
MRSLLRAGTCSFPERKEIALLRARGKGVRKITRDIGRHPGTVFR